jgi:NAD(P)-dependent dehydrogenase (short-subunit alcohol dehydrogenase family)
MDLLLAGKTVLITGASKGIGLATACLLAEEGCHLILTARNVENLAKAVETVRTRANVSVRTISADLSLTEDVERLAASCGEIDILVNNAGAIPPGNLLNVDGATWRKAWDLKVFGFIDLTRALYENLKQRQGVIVNVIGAAGERFPPDYIVGSSGNAALMAFTRALSKSAHKDGMRVVGVSPGPVSTERHEMLLRDTANREFGDAERWRELQAKLPFGRAATALEIASAIAFLASSRSAYTNGAILTIDGAPA